jgi:3D-(3,5/4)-trihydroxycyclohexane-1,2-dione acylhydrolase (decyclizing)
MVGDGSYLMMNSEIATSVRSAEADHRRARQSRLRLHQPPAEATGGASFNNLFGDALAMPRVDFAAHAASLGAYAEKVDSLADLPAALDRARESPITVVVLDTDPIASTGEGGAWWDVAVPEVSTRREVTAARAAYVAAIARRDR